MGGNLKGLGHISLVIQLSLGSKYLRKGQFPWGIGISNAGSHSGNHAVDIRFRVRIGKDFEGMDHEECRLLFDAGRALINKSGLASYDSTRFVACQDIEAFKVYWQKKFHPIFGRYMAWVLFSVGAENLAKAACVCKSLLKHTDKPDLGDYTARRGKKRYFTQLLNDGDARSKLMEGYRRLETVRNRDAHSYRENKRDANFPEVKDTFAPAFDVLVEAMQRNGHPLP